MNPAAASLLGYERDELYGHHAAEILFSTGVDGNDIPPDSPIQASCMTGIRISAREEIFRRKDGSPLALEFSCTPIAEDDKPAGAVVTLQDVSERKRYLAELERKSNFDDLTGLPNRNLLNDRLAGAIARCSETHGGLAVLTINLDRFKSINDSLGHGAGDQVLRDVAARLGAVTGKMDTLARLDGDEFVLVAESTETDAPA
ncbi:MAG: diguanylate cyclase, partial [Sulfuritalea sp.]|nr:diguanylate cyclase [Sulfuritalea sp.]